MGAAPISVRGGWYWGSDQMSLASNQLNYYFGLNPNVCILYLFILGSPKLCLDWQLLPVVTGLKVEYQVPGSHTYSGPAL